MARTEELSGIQRGTVIGCHLSNKSVHQISAQLELPWSTVSAVIVKWKRQGATTAQLWSGKPHQLTERDRRVLKHVAPSIEHQSPDLNPVEHLLDDLELRLRARLNHPTSVPELTNALVAEWKQILAGMFQHLMESLPRRVVAVVAAKWVPTPH